MKAIRPLIPIRFEEIKIAIKLPAEYAAKAYAALPDLAPWQSRNGRTTVRG